MVFTTIIFIVFIVILYGRYRTRDVTEYFIDVTDERRYRIFYRGYRRKALPDERRYNVTSLPTIILNYFLFQSAIGRY